MHRVRLHLSTVVVLFLAAVSAFAAPEAISDLTALATTTEGAITLTWTSPGGGATGYLVKYADTEIFSTDLEASWTTTYVQNWTPSAAGAPESHTLTNLTPGATLYFAVVAKDGGDNYGTWSGPSETGGVCNSSSSAVSFDAVPAQAAGVTLGRGNTCINLSWTANTEIDIQDYRIECSSYSDTEGFTRTVTILFPGTTHYDGGLVNGNTYYYRVCAEDKTGHAGSFSVVQSTMPWITLDTPSLNAVYSKAVSTTSINWSFNPLASNASGYYIVSSSGDRISPELGPSTTFWIQTGLTPSTSFSACVQAVNGFVTSNSSPLRYYALANPPANLASTQTTSTIDLTWSHNDNNPEGTRYTVRRSSDNVAYSILMNLAYSTTCQDTGLLEGVTYYYKVWATNGDGIINLRDNNQYAFVSTTTPRVLPADPAIDDIGYGGVDGDIRIRWIASGEDGTSNGPCGSYAVKWASYTITAGNFDAILSSVSVPATRQFPSSEPDFYIGGLFPGTTYHFAVKAIDHSGNLSGMSSMWSWPAADIAPGMPTNVTATALSSSTVSVSWTKPIISTLAYNDLDKYKIYRATVSLLLGEGNIPAYVIGSSTITEFGVNGSSVQIRYVNYTAASPFTVTDAGLAEETTYYYRVSVLDKGDQGNGLYSCVLESRLSDTTGYARTPDTIAPGQITELTALPGSVEGDIALAWTAPGDNGYGGQINGGKYRIDYSTDPLKVFTVNQYKIEFSTAGVNPGETEMREVTGLAAGSTYYLRVWTADEAGNWSVLSPTATSWAQVDITPPAAVTDLAATAVWSRAILSWTAPGDDGSVHAISGGIYEIRVSTEGAITDANWDSVPSGSPYRISIPTSTLPGQPEAYSVAGLTNGTTYYFAVRTLDERGNPSGVSTTSPEAKPFNRPPDAFVLTGPADNAISTDGLPVLTWAPAFDPDGVYGDTVSYVIQFATSSDFASYGTLSRSVSWGSPDLRDVYEDKTVYWRVIAADLSGASTPSSTAYSRVRVNIVNTAPAAFTLMSPASGTIVTTLTPNLTWNASSDSDPGDTVTYQVDYSRSADFAAYTSSNGITDTSYVTPALIENATYYWRVWANDGTGKDNAKTLCSTTFYFRVNATPEAPNSFSLSEPADNAVLSTTTAVFSWQSTVDPDPGEDVSYELTWSNVANFATSTTVTGLTGTTTTFYNYAENSVIYWFVTALGSDGNRRQSNGMCHFYVDVTKELPGPFNLLEPGYNVVVSTTLRPIFSWSKAADPDPADDVRYIIDISPNADFTGIGTVAIDRGPDRYYIPLINLTDQTTYYWRVRAAGYQGNPIPVKVDFPGEELYTFSSSTGVFVISMTNSPPQDFVLLSPANGSAVRTRKPALQWGQAADTDVNSIVRYAVAVATSADFGTVIESSGGIEGAEYSPASPFLENRTYYWKVTAVDNKGAQTVCPAPFSFTIPVLTVPLAPSGLKGTLASNKLKFTITWTGVNKNSNNTDIDDLAGYVIYRGLSTQKMNRYAFVPAGTDQWIDENTDGGNLYYRVRAIDSSDIESAAEDSPVLNSLSADTLHLLSEDRSFDVEVPPDITRYLLASNNPYHNDLYIKFERNTAAEAASDTIVYSYTVRILNAAGTALTDISLSQPLTLRFGYGSGTGAPARFAAMKVAAAQLGELNVYWNNGIEFMRVGGANDAADQQVTLKTTRPGEYQLRRVSRAPSFGVASIYPPKVFTPGTAPYAEIQFTVDNPTGDKVTGKIFDVRGDFVADLRPSGDAMSSSVILKWDGKTSDGANAPKGVYLYQIEGSGKILNGTIMVAR